MTEQPEQATPESTAPAEATPTEHMIPKSRFDEVNNRFKELQAQLEGFQKQQQDAKEAELVEQNKWRELAEQRQSELEKLQGLQDEVTRFRDGFNSTLKNRLAQIPDDKKHLVPEYDDPIKLSTWLDKALPDLIETPKPKAPSLDGGSGSGNSVSSTPLSATHETLADLAQQYGYSVNKERIAQYATSPPKPTNNTGE